MKLTRLASVAVVATVSACVDVDPVRPLCSDVGGSDVLPAGIFVQVVDSISGANAASGAKLVVRSGTYADSATGTGQAQAGLWAGQRAGTYEVTVTKPGYSQWARSNVDVELGECGFIGVSLIARLQPE